MHILQKTRQTFRCNTVSAQIRCNTVVQYVWYTWCGAVSTLGAVQMVHSVQHWWYSWRNTSTNYTSSTVHCEQLMQASLFMTSLSTCIAFAVFPVFLFDGRHDGHIHRGITQVWHFIEPYSKQGCPPPPFLSSNFNFNTHTYFECSGKRTDHPQVDSRSNITLLVLVACYMLHTVSHCFSIHQLSSHHHTIIPYFCHHATALATSHSCTNMHQHIALLRHPHRTTAPPAPHHRTTAPPAPHHCTTRTAPPHHALHPAPPPNVTMSEKLHKA